MKSKELKIYNIPRETPPLLTMSIKPTKQLVITLLAALLGSIILNEYSVFFLVIVAICLYALVAMPDRTLLEVYEGVLVVYDDLQHNTCYCIYWEDLLTWQYIKNQNGDKLTIKLTDGLEIKTDIYRSSRLLYFLNVFAKGKEKKVIRKRGKLA